MASVTLENVTKKFGNVVAVNKANLQIQDKEFVVLVGPSGCGKSTTLRMVAGLEEITEGNIFIGDNLVNDVPPKDRDIAMVFQNYALYPHMNVYDNMAFGLKLRKFPRAEIDKRVKEAARILGIENLLTRKPKELSGGQRQRVAVGRAIVREPKVFLMDEPLSNLDAKLRVQMRAELSKLHRRLEATIIYVTHDQTEAMTMGDRIVVMKDGLIQQVGAPLEVYEHPVNVFVAGFIGSPAMNFLEGVIRRDNGQYYIDAEPMKLPIPQEKAAQFRKIGEYIDKKVIFGIRPEDIDDTELMASPDPGSTVVATIDVVEPMGSESYLYATVGPHSFVARVDPRTAAKDGEPHRVTLNMKRVHLFDKETERAID
ncbi:sn-glycerol-3-phosphate ABC transporter ATP-binding protein UgpC [Carboxydochorda subterranea]|uniref:Sn-glycerol-3-phosphate ABC transporter ATP-binding protein UgpC n=1 Tax=Carboxydichorda subterranea TaxID=3109565 RepID=A0ABZ1BZS6_9FIRM|nr:sn-glycerol-3-phosphate ABC transporter ATP-binding protein UgpC [Limnochorda sp. L945t]WRP18016.1 sn-glycerol-3-phosphate ABC transporter ATP-binding protein UgpC [Limnochorda sp. L945t]